MAFRAPQQPPLSQRERGLLPAPPAVLTPPGQQPRVIQLSPPSRNPVKFRAALLGDGCGIALAKRLVVNGNPASLARSLRFEDGAVLESSGSGGARRSSGTARSAWAFRGVVKNVLVKTDPRPRARVAACRGGFQNTSVPLCTVKCFG